MTTLARPAAPATRRSALRITTRVLLVLFGTLKLAATGYFLFFATAAEGGDPQGSATGSSASGRSSWAPATWSSPPASAGARCRSLSG